MKKVSMAITWIIAGLILMALAWYGVLLLMGANADGDAPGVIRYALIGVVVVVIVPIMVAMIVTAVRRNREIEKGEDDDLGQY